MISLIRPDLFKSGNQGAYDRSIKKNIWRMVSAAVRLLPKLLIPFISYLTTVCSIIIVYSTIDEEDKNDVDKDVARERNFRKNFRLRIGLSPIITWRFDNNQKFHKRLYILEYEDSLKLMRTIRHRRTKKTNALGEKICWIPAMSRFESFRSAFSNFRSRSFVPG